SLFQVISYLYFAPFRQQNLRIISKLDQSFPEMMMIERSLLRNLDKGFIESFTDYITKLRLYIPFILLKDRLLIELSGEIERPEFQKILSEKTAEFKRKFPHKDVIPTFDGCIERMSKRIDEIAQFAKDLVKQLKQTDDKFLAVYEILKTALKTEEEMKESIVEYLELNDVKNVEKRFLTIAYKIHDGKRRIKYFGALKFVTPGEVSKEWKMCILFNDILIIARPFVFGKKTTRERENLLRFENSPRGRDVSELSGYRFNEEIRIPMTSPIQVKNIVDTESVHNAFMFECFGIKKHCMCVSMRERDNWVQALLVMDGDNV
ncbi:hypothetical protein EIN_268610, partial [Entamoeba invadens IP1]